MLSRTDTPDDIVVTFHVSGWGTVPYSLILVLLGCKLYAAFFWQCCHAGFFISYGNPVRKMMQSTDNRKEMAVTVLPTTWPPSLSYFLVTGWATVPYSLILSLLSCQFYPVLFWQFCHTGFSFISYGNTVRKMLYRTVNRKKIAVTVLPLLGVPSQPSFTFTTQFYAVFF